MGRFIMDYEEKDLDTFPTTYQKDFIWHRNFKRFHPCKNVELPISSEDTENFINPGDFKKIPREEQLEIIKKLYAHRMRTSYQEGYCKERKNVVSGREGIEDTLILGAIKLFSDRSQKVLAPPSTSRRVYGYCRPANYYTGFSEYQGVYSFMGYKKLMERGAAARLAPRVKNCPKT